MPDHDGIVGCYSLHLYCRYRFTETSTHVFPNEPFDFIGYDRTDAFRDARKAGFRMDLRERTVICPVCWKKGLR